MLQNLDNSRVFRVAVTVVVLTGQLMPMGTLAQETSSPSDGNRKFTHVNGDASKILRQLINARTNSDESQQSLAAEIDMLAGLHLNLQQPEAVEEIYLGWYGNNADMRTPAAYLIRARAKIMHARLMQEGMSEKTAGDGTDNSKTQLFESTLVALIGDENGAEKYVSDLISADGKLWHWVSTTFKNELPSEVKVSGTDYHEFMLEGYKLLAIIRRETGDLTFRMTGSSLRNLGTKNSQKTASALYSEARQALYTARLLGGSDDPEFLAEANAIRDRIQWIKDGLLFGSIEFYVVRPFSAKNNIGAIRKGLINQITEVETLQGARNIARANALKIQIDSENRLKDRDLLKQGLKSQAFRELRSQILDLRNEILQLERDDRTEMIRLAQVAHERLLETLQAEVQIDSFQNDLREQRRLLEREFQRCLSDLAELGPGSGEQFDEIIGGFYGVSEKDWNGDEKEAGIEGFALSQPGRIANLFDAFVKSSGGTRLDIARDNALVRKEAVDRAQLEIDAYNAARDVEKLKSRVKEFEAALEGKRADIDKLWQDFDEEKTIAVNEQDAENLARQLAENYQPMISELKQDIVNGLDEIKKFQDQVQDVKQTLENFKKHIATVQELKTKFQAVVATARAIPKTITGMMSGAEIDPGSVIEGINNAAISLADSISQGTIDTVKMKEWLNKNEEALTQRVGRLQEQEQHLRNAKLLKIEGIAELRLRDLFSKPPPNDHTELGGTKFQAYQQREEWIREDIRNKSAVMGKWMAKLDEAQEIVAGREESILNKDLKEAEAMYSAAVQTEMMYRRQMAGKILQLKQLVEQMRELGKAIDDATGYDTYDKVIKSEADALRNGEKKVVGENERTSEQIIASTRMRIAQIDAELAELNRPESRRMSADLLRELSPAVLTLGAVGDNKEHRVALDKANKLVFDYANWLYLLSGDDRCIEWAIACQTVEELKLVNDQLEVLKDSALERLGHANNDPVLLTVSIDNGHLVELSRANAKSCVVRLRPGKQSFNSTEAERDQGHWRYTDVEINRAVVSCSPARLDTFGSSPVVYSMWVVPHWTPGGSKEVPDIAALPKFTVRPVGNNRLRKADRVFLLPFRPRYSNLRGVEDDLSLREVAHDPKEPTELLARCKKVSVDGFIDWISDGTKNASLEEYVGYSLETDWELAFANPSDAQADFKYLDRLELSFLILPTKERIAGAQHSNGPIEQRSSPPGTLDDLIAQYTQESEMYGDAYANSPAGRSMRLRMLELALHDVTNHKTTASATTQQIKQLWESAPDVMPNNARDADLVRKEVESQFVKGMLLGTQGGKLRVLAPIRLSASLAVAKRVLSALNQDFTENYFEPVEAASDVLKGLAMSKDQDGLTPLDHMQAMGLAVERLNAEFDEQEQSCRNLEALLEQLQPVGLGNEIDHLKKLVQRVLEGRDDDLLELEIKQIVAQRPELSRRLLIELLTRWKNAWEKDGVLSTDGTAAEFKLWEKNSEKVVYPRS